MLVCPKCGGQKFTASQDCVCDIIVDGNNEFLANNTEDNSLFISYADLPYGPYCCTNCGAEYDVLEDELIERNDLIGRRVRCDEEEGTLASIDDLERLHVNMDDGSELLLIPGADKYEILEPEEEEDEEEGEDVRILLKNVSFEELSRVREFLNNQEIEVEEL